MKIRTVLKEQELPVNKEDVPDYEDSYAKISVIMKPELFISLTTGDEKTVSDLEYDNQEYDYHYDPDDYDVPFLKVLYNSGKIIGHEGRHRCVWAIDNKYDKVPVTLYYYDKYYYIKYDNKKEVFSNIRLAKNRVNSLIEDDGIFDIKIHIGHDPIPDFTNNLLPKVLIGQFNNKVMNTSSIVLDKSQYEN